MLPRFCIVCAAAKDGGMPMRRLVSAEGLT